MVGQDPKDRQITIKVRGMTCGHCKNRVEKIAKDTKGVQTANVDLGEGKLTIKASPAADIAGLKARIKQAGYSTE